MGAALTYARRYALFTLVGIAGEDDLDAPDLCDPAPSARRSPISPQCRPALSAMGGAGIAKGGPSAIIDAEQSATIRDRLLAEIGNIASSELAASWARDRSRPRTGSQHRMPKLWRTPLNSGCRSSPRPEQARMMFPHWLRQILAASRAATTASDPSAGIDKSVLAVAAPRRYRNREHLRFVAKQACLVCGRKPSDPHHLRYLQPRALGRKASDEFAVPLCRVHHRALHRARDERAWWQAAGIDPIPVARKLWDDSRREEARTDPDRVLQAAAADRAVEPQAPA